MIESFVSNFAHMLPFGYAFGAGMVTTVSPCGIAMLPAYVSLHLGTASEARSESLPRRGVRALLMSAAVTVSFVFLFGIIGVLASVGGQFLFKFIPWMAIFIGISLILMGTYLTLGGHVYTALPARLAARFGNSGKPGVKGFMVFGLAYAVAALSCTLPVFLAVTGSALATRGLASGMLQFVSYALGMGFVITLVAVGSLLFRKGMEHWLRRLVPLVARFSGALLILAGGYILYFWFITGDILNRTF